MTRPRVYLAHPVTSYGTEHEAVCLATLVTLLPGAELIDPSTRYTSSAGWLRAWPRLVPTLDAVVLYADVDGTIGAGCLRELADAVAARVPVAMLDGGGTLCELAAVDLLPPDARTATTAAWLVGGGPMDARWLLTTMRRSVEHVGR